MKPTDVIYKLVSKIPPGKVATYGQIAQLVHTSPRVVGNALHRNSDSEIPCHRVVNVYGEVAENYAFGGAKAQRKKLQSEGIVFFNQRINLSKNLFSF